MRASPPRFHDPEALDFKGEPIFPEPYLVPIAVASTSAGGLRKKIETYLESSGKTKEAAAQLASEKEKNRAAERDRELKMEVRPQPHSACAAHTHARAHPTAPPPAPSHCDHATLIVHLCP